MTAKLFGLNNLEYFKSQLDASSREVLAQAVKSIVEVKKRGGKITVVTGSGPNIHEGVTTLIAELIRVGIIDGVTEGSMPIIGDIGKVWPVLAYEAAKELDIKLDFLSSSQDTQEGQAMRDWIVEAVKPLDEDLLARGKKLKVHSNIIKAAGNMAYPMGLRGERIALEILNLAKIYGLPFEQVAGWGCDEHTMLGAADIPVLVTIPQLVGGGAVGMSIGDSISVSNRSMRISRMLAQSDIIIESAVALTQEIHDGPFECYTGHGIWAAHSGQSVYNLKSKKLIRIDLDENLRKCVELNNLVQEAIDKGLPKTKAAKIPFRMEMSAFARHEGSMPIIGDIGKVWPVLAYEAAKELDIKLDFLSSSQDTQEGQAMRDWIVEAVKPLDLNKMRDRARNFKI